MEDELIRLLEKIEKAGLKGIGKIQLKNELKESDAPIAPHVTEKLIKEAHKRGLIRDDIGQSKPEDSSDRDDMVCVLTITGFELLNQIWIKKAIVQFDKSSDESYKKIIDLTDKLGLSVEDLYESSEQLERFTFALIGFTVLLAVIAVIELVKDFIPRWAVAILGFGLLAGLISIMYIITKIGNKMIPK